MEISTSRSIRIYDINEDILPKVLKVLELIIEFSDKRKCKKKKLYSEVQNQYSVIHISQHKNVTTGKRCHDLVIQSISSHRYEESAKLFWILCNYKSILQYSLFKIGLILLMNLKTIDHSDWCLNFFRCMLDFAFLNKRETLLEFIMCGLKCELPDIQGQVTELANRKMMNYSRKNDKIDSLYDAYILLLDWCKAFSGDMNMSQSQTNKEVVKPKKYNENSDVFILKLMKVFEFCDKQNEVENELLRYVESNPDNVNALIYICTYLYHCHPNSDKLISYLEILAEKCISDVRTLWLIEIWSKKGVCLVKILNYCFMFLDYPTNGRNVDAWKSLSKNLKNAKKKMTGDDFQSIVSLWEIRKRSWSWMYFNPQQLSNIQSNNKLIAYKVVVLLFFGEGKKYIKKVSKYHPDVLQLAESLRN